MSKVAALESGTKVEAPPRAPFQVFAAEGRDQTPAPTDDHPHVVIVGAGFAGLACAKQLGNRNVRVTVVDRNNYHLFVPLLYQVATAALSPADIAEPIRKVLRRYRNIDIVMAEVVGIDSGKARVLLADGGFFPTTASSWPPVRNIIILERKPGPGWRRA